MVLRTVLFSSLCLVLLAPGVAAAGTAGVLPANLVGLERGLAALQCAPVAVATGPGSVWMLPMLAVAQDGSEQAARPSGRRLKSVTRTSSRESEGSGGSSAVPTHRCRVTICHTPNGPNPRTITIRCSSLFSHLAHGDYIGRCSASPDGPKKY